MDELLEELPNTGRIPCRPLSFENRDLALKKEFIIDYINHRAYTTDSEGNIHDITANVSEIVDSVVEEFTNNPDKFNQIQIEIDGEQVSVISAITDTSTKVKDIYTYGASHIITVRITASSWIEGAGGGYYYKDFNVNNITQEDQPIVSLKLSSDDYNECITPIEEYNKIYKITTNNGSIRVYAYEPIKTNIFLYFKIDGLEE